MLLSGETVNVAIRNGNEAVLIGQLECKSMVRMCAPLGSRLPLHASGAGKALLYPLAEEDMTRSRCCAVRRAILLPFAQ